MPDEGDIAQEKYEQFLEARIAEHRHKRNAPRPPLNLRGGVVRCIDCDDVIPEKRWQVVPGCQRCIECQKAFEEGR